MNWNKRYKEMKSALKITNADIAIITGHTADSIKSITQPNAEFPRSLRLAVVVFESMQNDSSENIRKVINELKK